MVIDVAGLLKNFGTSMDIKFDKQVNGLEFDNDNVEFFEPVQVEGTITNMGETLLFEGNISTMIKATCDRCLQEFNHNFNININEKFAREPKQHIEDINLFSGNHIHMEDIIKENILLNLPIQYVCDEECEGLCPECGLDRNINVCNCVRDNIDPRLEKLKKFFE